MKQKTIFLCIAQNS